MTPTPRFSEYSWDGGREWMMSFGPEDGPQLLIVPPLLEELNRTRKLVSDIMRALADGGVASHLLDLPGTGESGVDLTATSLDHWKGAVAAASQHIGAETTFGVRGGCLIDHAIADFRGDIPGFRFAPVEGKRLIRDLVRARSITDKSFDSAAQQAVFEAGPTMLGGYPVTASLASALRGAEPAARGGMTTIRLEGDHGDADQYIAGTPLWRRAEPSGSPEMAQTLARILVERLT